MVDQLYPNQRDRTDLDDEVLKYLDEVEGMIGADIDLVGTGPNTVTEV